MFSIPLLPPLPAFLAPSALLSPISALLSRPTKIDYSSIPLLPSLSSKTAGGHVSSPAKHQGPLADLPLDTCPICHLRQSAAPRPLDSIGAGSGISLPPISGSGQDEAAGQEETRIFVPAQSDCWGGCRWCYYCIGEELYKHHESVKRRQKEKGGGGKKGRKFADGEKEEEQKDKGWSCLRCGGSVSRAWRVGAGDGREGMRRILGETSGQAISGE